MKDLDELHIGEFVCFYRRDKEVKKGYVFNHLDKNLVLLTEDEDPLKRGHESVCDILKDSMLNYKYCHSSDFETYKIIKKRSSLELRRRAASLKELTIKEGNISGSNGETYFDAEDYINFYLSDNAPLYKYKEKMVKEGFLKELKQGSAIIRRFKATIELRDFLNDHDLSWYLERPDSRRGIKKYDQSELIKIARKKIKKAYINKRGDCEFYVIPNLPQFEVELLRDHYPMTRKNGAGEIDINYYQHLTLSDNPEKKFRKQYSKEIKIGDKIRDNLIKKIKENDFSSDEAISTLDKAENSYRQHPVPGSTWESEIGCQYNLLKDHLKEIGPINFNSEDPLIKPVRKRYYNLLKKAISKNHIYQISPIYECTPLVKYILATELFCKDI